MVINMPTALLNTTLVGLLWVAAASAAEPKTDELPWPALKTYQYAEDLKPLLALERAAYASLKDPAQRQQVAQRFVDAVADPKATTAGRQFAAVQLRVVGTAAQVPTLARLAADPSAGPWARYALEAIPGPESATALRAALPQLKGAELIGTINSLGARHDVPSAPALIQLAGQSDRAVAHAAINALGKLPSADVIATLQAAKGKAGSDLLPAAGLVRVVAALQAAGQKAVAASLFQELSAPGQAPAIRRAALRCTLQAMDRGQTAKILQWLAGDDADARRVAAGFLSCVKDKGAKKELLAGLGSLPVAGRALLMQWLAEQQVREVLPALVTAAKANDPVLRLAGIQGLGLIGEAAQVPLLLDALAADEPIATAARQSLIAMHDPQSETPLLAALKTAPATRQALFIEILTQRLSTAAIPVLAELAARPDPKEYDGALDGLRDLARPCDLPQLLLLMFQVEKQGHRDEVEKLILVISGRIEEPQARADAVLEALAKADAARRCTLLPLAGRIGGKKALAVVDVAIADKDPAVHEAGLRALCNWPDPSVADRLLTLAQKAPEPAQQVMAMRAYIRVISLPDQRPDTETLALLQQAMRMAGGDAEKRLIVSRCGAVRTIETLRWLVSLLDDPKLAQEACSAIVDLAHNRPLRVPNRKEFTPALKRVIEVSKSRSVADRAKEYLD